MQNSPHIYQRTFIPRIMFYHFCFGFVFIVFVLLPFRCAALIPFLINHFPDAVLSLLLSSEFMDSNGCKILMGNPIRCRTFHIRIH